jgi:hypothetical protein
MKLETLAYLTEPHIERPLAAGVVLDLTTNAQRPPRVRKDKS